MRNGAVTNDVRGVVEKTAIDSSVEGQFDFARFEWANRGRRDDIFGKDMGMAAAIAAGRLLRFDSLAIAPFGRLGCCRLRLLLWLGFSGAAGRAVDGQFRLVRNVFAFRCHSISN